MIIVHNYILAKLLFAPTIASLIILITIFFLIIVTYIIFEKITSIQRKAKHTKEVTELKHNYEQAILRSQLEIQEATLRTISQEIHDNIGQVLSLAKLQLNTFFTLPPESNAEAIVESRQLVSKAIADLRSLSKSLNPDRVNELGLEENIRHELDMLQRTRRYQTCLQVTGTVYELPVHTQTILFRIVQEAISNIIKHAEAGKVTITISYVPDEFTLRITDDGVGINTEKAAKAQSGIGLKNMHSRSGVIGAAFTLQPADGGGTTVQICLPK